MINLRRLQTQSTSYFSKRFSSFRLDNQHTKVLQQYHYEKCNYNTYKITEKLVHKFLATISLYKPQRPKIRSARTTRPVTSLSTVYSLSRNRKRVPRISRGYFYQVILRNVVTKFYQQIIVTGRHCS